MKIVMDAVETSANTRDMVFLDLERGDVFFDGDETKLYIRTELFSNEFEDYNAVCLKTGDLAFFDKGDKVCKYEGLVTFNPIAFNNKVAL